MRTLESEEELWSGALSVHPVVSDGAVWHSPSEQTLSAEAETSSSESTEPPKYRSSGTRAQFTLSLLTVCNNNMQVNCPACPRTVGEDSPYICVTEIAIKLVFLEQSNILSGKFSSFLYSKTEQLEA